MRFGQLPLMHVPANPAGVPLPSPEDDPDPCEIGEHPDSEDGYCLACGEYVGPEDAEEVDA